MGFLRGSEVCEVRMACGISESRRAGHCEDEHEYERAFYKISIQTRSNKSNPHPRKCTLSSTSSNKQYPALRLLVIPRHHPREPPLHQPQPQPEKAKDRGSMCVRTTPFPVHLFSFQKKKKKKCHSLNTPLIGLFPWFVRHLAVINVAE